MPLSWNVLGLLAISIHAGPHYVSVHGYACLCVGVPFPGTENMNLSLKKETLSKSEKYRLGGNRGYSCWLLIVTNPLCSCEMLTGNWTRVMGILYALCILSGN